MDSDLYLLFRFSLDDNTETMVSATLLALRNLLWNHPDEVQYSVVKAPLKKADISGRCRIVCVTVSKTFPHFLQVNLGWILK